MSEGGPAADGAYRAVEEWPSARIVGSLAAHLLIGVAT
jgi:hypothetical protein